MTTTMTGKTIRLNRLFDARSGRTVTVAVDHGIGGVPSGLEQPREALTAILAGEPDGLILTPGLLKSCADLFAGRSRPALFAAADLAPGSTFPGGPGGGEEYRLMAGAEELLRLGADGVKMLLIFGRESVSAHAENVARVAAMARACEAWGVPLMVEPVLWGRQVPEAERSHPRRVESISRIAIELGADLLKVPYPSDPAAFRRLVEASPVPVLVLGGARTESETDLLTRVAELISAGGRGLAFGRNVFQYPDPAAVIRALRALVHDVVDVEAAARLLRAA
jgi:DhnA family fructose-bisphosphate aldolase class Ia